MSEINHKDIDKVFKQDATLYLLYGDSFLYKKTYKKLIKQILPDFESSINYEVISQYEKIGEVIESLNTIPLLNGKKVLHLKDSNIFYTKENKEILLKKSIDTFSKNRAKGAKLFASLLGSLSISKDNFHKKKIKAFQGAEEKAETLFKYITDTNIKIEEKKDDSITLSNIIEKGFSARSILIVTTSLIDKRKSLFKVIKEKGVVVDCSIKKSFSNDKVTLDILKNVAQEILAKHNVRMNRASFDALYKLIGSDLERFAKEVEKLAIYAKDTKTIEREDVIRLVKRTKDDPIYEVSSAIAERDLFKALFFSNALLEKGYFPLQILAAIFNQIKKLFLIKDFLKSPFAKECHNENLSFNDFKFSLLKNLIAYDEDNANGEKSFPSLFIAKGKNPYAVYILFQKANGFLYEEFKGFFNDVSSADTLLKSSRQNHKIIIENLIMKICQ